MVIASRLRRRGFAKRKTFGTLKSAKFAKFFVSRKFLLCDANSVSLAACDKIQINNYTDTGAFTLTNLASSLASQTLTRVRRETT